MPIFDNNCFSPASPFFIPSFKNLRKPAASNNETTSHESGNKGLDEQEARKKLRVRKDQLRKDTDDDIVKYDKFHAANLLSRPSPATLADRDRDIVVTAAVHTQPPPPLSTRTEPKPVQQEERDTE